MAHVPDPPIDDEDDFVPVQSDVLNSVEPDPASLQNGPASVGGDISFGLGPTVVNLNDESGSDGEDITANPAPVANMDASDVKDELSSPAPAPAPVAKKRGRPPRSASRTPANVAVAKTPRSTKSTAAAPKSTGRKRKAESAEPESEAEQNRAKRGRPVRTTGVVASAKLAVWAAKAATRGKSTTTAKTTAAKLAKVTKPTKKPGKAGRPRKNTSNDESSAEEFEVEDIVESRIDAETKEHLYFVKWKGFATKDNTWEPKKNLAHALSLVKKFDANKKKEEGKEAAAPNEKKAKTEKKTPGRKRKAKT